VDARTRWVPGWGTLRTYRRAWLGHDLLAGLVLAAFLVPVGMGYAQAAGLPPINGLYATIVPLAAYAVFGPSRVMVLGPDSSLAPVIAAVVALLAGGSFERAVEVAGVLAIVTGLVIGLTGILRLGFVTELLSRPARVGYLTGIALTIIVGQIPKMLGFSTGGDGIGEQVGQIVEAIGDGYVNTQALLVSAGSLGVLAAILRWFPRWPGALVVVLGGIAAVTVFDLAVVTVGPLPQGLPTFAVPTVDLEALTRVLPAALGIALVAIADTSVLSQSLAMQRNEEVDADQELFALGAANVATGFFQGFPISSSASRTPVAIQAGARSQLTPLVGAAAVAALLVAAPELLKDLPQAVLGAVVVAAAVRLIDVHEIRTLWRIRRAEFLLWLAAFLGVLFLGVLAGVFVAIVLSLGDFVRRAWRPYDAVLGRVDELKGYHDRDRFPDARTVPGLLLFRFDAPLFFANANHFRAELRRRVAEEPDTRWIVIAAEPITDVDTTAAIVLEDLLEEFDAQGITLAFAEMKDPVKDHLRRYGLFDRVGTDRFFPTMGTAVDAYVRAAEVEWVDWEERGRRGHGP
jgi:high affinity sulfate transporter 1